MFQSADAARAGASGPSQWLRRLLFGGAATAAEKLVSRKLEVHPCTATGAEKEVVVRVVHAFGRPVGVVAGEHGVRWVVLGQALSHVDGAGRAHYWAELAAQQLGEYFAGSRRRFTVTVDLDGLGEFCRRVLAVCMEIPFGQVRSYGWVGETAQLGRKAARAVGRALAANPVPILVPCHRVIRSDGSPGGFAAGLEWKKLLLTLEAQYTKA